MSDHSVVVKMIKIQIQSEEAIKAQSLIRMMMRKFPTKQIDYKFPRNSFQQLSVIRNVPARHLPSTAMCFLLKI
ncbi:hypothetical protein TSPI_10207 [Trichinella spiralis]|uniref:Uncharacterized protein n=1 Tax=Trichinella spiralis TaxID=6334 RepID=A0ABR3KXI3_TRISP